MDSSTEIPFVHNEAREATGAIAGYVYQVRVTILRWLTLTEQEELDLERGEDIDIIQRHLATGADLRTMEQVKHLSDPVGLRSPSALTSVAHFRGHRLANPTHQIKFRYVTTAGVHGERDSPFEDNAAGIIVWHEIWTGRTPDGQLGARLAGIRSILRNSAKPTDVRNADWSALQTFLASASDPELLSFIRAFEWSTDYLSSDEVERSVYRSLQTRKPTATSDEIEEIYSWLFVFVFKTLARPGPKRLTPDMLNEELLRPSARVEDRELLSVLRATLISLQTRVSGIEDHQIKILEAVARINRPLDLAQPEIVADPPPLVGHAIPRVEAVKAVQSVLARVAWCALHGESSCGKSQLALLVTMAQGARTIWIRLRDHTPEACCAILDRSLELASGKPRTYAYEQWFRESCLALGPQTTIVLDDLPRTTTESLNIRLLLLALASSAAKINIISTAYDPLAAKLRDGLSSAVEELQTPNFSDDDITDLLKIFGAPPDGAAGMAQIVAAVTRRHAWLARAAAQHLAGRNWTLDAKVLDELFRRDFAKGIEEQIRRSLLATTTKETRALLNRLLLCEFAFTKEDIGIVAAVQPRIDLPMDDLNPALGLWVQQEGPNSFSASALLHQIGSDTLEETKVGVHLALGRAILGKRKLSPTEGMSAFRHFYAAGDKKQPALILLRALMALVSNNRPVLEDPWGFTLIWVDRALPSHIPLSVRLMLRSYQLIANHRRGRSTTYLFRDLDALMKRATRDEGWAVAMSAGLIPLEIGRDYPSKANEYILKMLDLLPAVRLPSGSPLPIPKGTEPESLLWMTASGIENAAGISDWSATVSKLTPQQQKRLFSSKLAPLQSLLLCEGIWDRERKKSPDGQDWSGALGQVLTIDSLARAINNELLLGCAARARTTILGEFMAIPDEANDIATAAYASVRPSSPSALLISEAAARVLALHKHRDAGREWAQKAVVAETGEFSLIKRDALLLLGRLLPPTEFRMTAELCRQALDLIRTSANNPTALVQTLGECSVALWNVGDRKEAFLALEEAVTTLLEDDRGGRLWKRLFVVCGHTAGYMASMSHVGSPPTIDYAAPMPGMFLAEGTLDDLYDPNIEGMIALQLALFADAIGLVAASSTWNRRAQHAAELLGTSNITADFNWLGVAQAIDSEDFGLALDLARRAVGDRSEVTEAQLRSLRIQDPKQWLERAKRLETTTRGDSRAMLIGALPTAIHIASVYQADQIRARSLAQRAADACRAARNKDTWEATATVFERLLESPDWRELAALGSSVSDDNSALANICYLAVAVQSELRQSLYMQYAIMQFADAFYMKTFRGLYIPFVSFVELFWQHALQHSGFEFRTPAFTRRMVDQAAEFPIENRIRAILRAVTADLNVKPKPPTRTWLDTYQE